MKADPEDIRKMAEDLQGALQRHTDAVRNNPDLASEVVKVRDKWTDRYRKVTEVKTIK